MTRSLALVCLLVMLGLSAGHAAPDPWRQAIHQVRAARHLPKAQARAAMDGAADRLQKIPGTAELQRRLRTDPVDPVLSDMEQLDKLRAVPVPHHDPQQVADTVDKVLSQPEYQEAARNAQWTKDILETLARWWDWLFTRPIGAAGVLIWLVVWALLVALVVVVVLTLSRWTTFRFAHARAVAVESPETFAPRLARDWFEAAQARVQEGDLRQAVHLAFKAILARVHEQPGLVYDDRLTHREMQARLDRAGFPLLSGAVAKARRFFEPVCYGGMQPTLDTWHALEGVYHQLDVQA